MVRWFYHSFIWFLSIYIDNDLYCLPLLKLMKALQFLVLLPIFELAVVSAYTEFIKYMVIIVNKVRKF